MATWGGGGMEVQGCNQGIVYEGVCTCDSTLIKYRVELPLYETQRKHVSLKCTILYWMCIKIDKESSLIAWRHSFQEYSFDIWFVKLSYDWVRFCFCLYLGAVFGFGTSNLSLARLQFKTFPCSAGTLDHRDVTESGKNGRPFTSHCHPLTAWATQGQMLWQKGRWCFGMPVSVSLSVPLSFCLSLCLSAPPLSLSCISTKAEFHDLCLILPNLSNLLQYLKRLIPIYSMQ